jgi:hypothetical protein
VVGGRWTLTGFVDFANAVSADPVYGIANAFMYSEGHPVREAALLDGYGPLPDGWPERLRLYRTAAALISWNWRTETGRDRVDSYGRLLRTLVSR